MSTPRDLYQQLRYQLAPVGVSTWGECSADCGGSSRGSGMCAECLVDALMAHVPAVNWDQFLITMRKSAEAIVEAEQAIEDAERGR